jgi:predicted ATPase
MNAIHTLSITGFRSIRNLQNLRLSNLNVLIGANGAGKSNFVAYFRMLSELVEGRLQVWVAKQGGADRVLSYGLKETSALKTSVRFGINGYDIEMEPTGGVGLTFTSEKIFFDGRPGLPVKHPWLGAGHAESKLKNEMLRVGGYNEIARHCYQPISGWKVYHFHDTSDTAGVKRQSSVHDNAFLRMAYLSKIAAPSCRLSHSRSTARTVIISSPWAVGSGRAKAAPDADAREPLVA